MDQDTEVKSAAAIMGSIGGKRTKERHGAEFYRTIGKKGGMATKQSLGEGHYQEAGSVGGEKTRALYGQDHYAEMGKRRWSLLDRAKKAETERDEARKVAREMMPLSGFKPDWVDSHPWLWESSDGD